MGYQRSARATGRHGKVHRPGRIVARPWLMQPKADHCWQPRSCTARNGNICTQLGYTAGTWHVWSEGEQKYVRGETWGVIEPCTLSFSWASRGQARTFHWPLSACSLHIHWHGGAGQVPQDLAAQLLYNPDMPPSSRIKPENVDSGLEASNGGGARGLKA